MRYYQSQYSGYKKNQPQKEGFFSRLFKRKKKPTPVSAGPTARYNNPYSKTKKKTIAFPFKTVGFILLIGSWLGLMVYLPYFRVTTVSYSGLKIIKEDEIKAVVNEYLEPKRFWPKNNFFLVNKENLSTILQEKFSLHAATIQKNFPHSINIVIEEKISSILYDNGLDYYLLDQSGVVLKHIRSVEEGRDEEITTTTIKLATTTTRSTISTSTSDFPTSTQKHVPDLTFLKKEYGDYPVIYDLRELVVGPEQVLASKDFVKGVIEFYSAFRHARLGVVHYGIVDEVNAGVTLITDKNWKIRFQPTHNIEEQIENISVIAKQYKPVEYIDVRFNERVYWK